MTQKPINIFIKKFYSKGREQNYLTNKSDIYRFDDIWSVDKLELKACGPENNTGYRYVLVIINSFSKIVWTTPLKNKNAQTIKSSI